jgi:hypothetical protein
MRWQISIQGFFYKELKLELFKGTGTFRIHFGTGTGTELFLRSQVELELGTFSEGGTLGTLIGNFQNLFPI